MLIQEHILVGSLKNFTKKMEKLAVSKRGAMWQTLSSLKVVEDALIPKDRAVHIKDSKIIKIYNL